MTATSHAACRGHSTSTSPATGTAIRAGQRCTPLSPTRLMARASRARPQRISRRRPRGVFGPVPEASIRRMLSQMHPTVYAAMRIVHFTMPGSCRAAVG